jgi:hypothetical protein
MVQSSHHALRVHAVERLAADAEVAAEPDVRARLAVADRAPGRVRRGDGERRVGQPQHVDLALRERVPERGLHERRERRELEERHRGRRVSG